MSDNNRNPQSDEELGPPKEDFGAPPPYELTNTLPTIVVPTGYQMYANQQLQQMHEQNMIEQNMIEQNMIEQNMIEQNSNYEQHQQPLQHGSPMIHGNLPTYEEVQMEESLNAGVLPVFLTQLPPHLLPPNPLIEDWLGENADTNSENLNNSHRNLLGSDIIFITAFMVAFLFNWIGFLIFTCFCHTVAARYGALAGFGLSLAKWTLIIKYLTELSSHESSWKVSLLQSYGYFLLSIGLWICFRGLSQYVRIRRDWPHLSTLAQERLISYLF